MNELQFEWDANKDLANQRKHSVSFDEARTVFYDENARLIHDPDHSGKEDRFVLLGFSSTLQLLVVVHCYWQQDEIIRIISARKATKQEQKQYFRRN